MEESDTEIVSILAISSERIKPIFTSPKISTAGALNENTKLSNPSFVWAYEVPCVPVFMTTFDVGKNISELGDVKVKWAGPFSPVGPVPSGPVIPVEPIGPFNPVGPIKDPTFSKLGPLLS